MSFMDLVRDRYSARKFTDEPVSQEDLDLVLEAGRLAPTAKNNQPQRVYVVRSEEGLATLNDNCRCIFGATTVVAIGYDSTEDWQNPLEEGIHGGVEDASIVATHMMLEAKELGLDTCWVNLFANSQVEKALGLPDEVRLVLLMPIGHAADGAGPSPRHTERKPLEETVTYL